MASPGLNVLRYSVGGFGVFYGFTHQRSINSGNAAAHEKAAYDHKLDLISKAKAEYAKKNIPSSATTSGGNVISDPNDKNFDLGAYLTSVETK